MKTLFTILFFLFVSASFAQSRAYQDSVFEAGTKKEMMEMVQLKKQGMKTKLHIKIIFYAIITAMVVSIAWMASHSNFKL